MRRWHERADSRGFAVRFFGRIAVLRVEPVPLLLHRLLVCELLLLFVVVLARAGPVVVTGELIYFVVAVLLLVVARLLTSALLLRRLASYISRFVA